MDSFETYQKAANASADAMIARVREQSARQGHQLSQAQIAWADLYGRDLVGHGNEEESLTDIEKTLERGGEWRRQEEWRISTWFEVLVALKPEHKGTPYFVSVECDGQLLSCHCPTLQQAMTFSRLYRQLIVDQFYSIGPPWADRTSK